MHTEWRFLGVFMYIHAMSYAKMFHGYDILKHGMTFTEKGCHFLDS